MPGIRGYLRTVAQPPRLCSVANLHTRGRVCHMAQTVFTHVLTGRAPSAQLDT